jgi:pimeloyl-ACP methyl ester carboxylesterase
MVMAVLAASGCATLAERIAEPYGESLIKPQSLAMVEQGWGLDTGSIATPEGVRIAYIHVPAADRGFEYTLAHEGKLAQVHFKATGAAKPIATRGTIVYLHGWGMDGSSMLPWALAFADRGYQGYALDLRNHGRSDRAPAGYGPREAGDVVAVMRKLQDDGKLQPPLYLFGISLGGTTALFAEPELHGELAGIIALEPFANAGDAIRGTIRGMLEYEPHSLVARVVHGVEKSRFARTDEDAAIREAGQALGLDLDAVDLAPVVVRSHTCTLLLHGAKDSWVDPEASRRLASLSLEVQFHAIPGMGHLTLPMRVDWLAAPIAGWLEAGNCAPIEIPTDPLDH